jgi:uncharacterized membrane protein YgdD (TMEM256/DUF423 family)
VTPLEALAVVASGVGAGAVNAVAGGGTLITFPVLLGLGLPPVEANTTTAAGLVVGYAGSARAYRPELAGQGGRVRALLVPAVLGSLLGVGLLLGRVASDGSLWLHWSGWLFVAGTLLFSGSLYILALTGIRWLGAVAPVGGLAFLAGWVCLAWSAWKG